LDEQKQEQLTFDDTIESNPMFISNGNFLAFLKEYPNNDKWNSHLMILDMNNSITYEIFSGLYIHDYDWTSSPAAIDLLQITDPWEKLMESCQKK
jgi:hypothetical protein